MSSSAQVRVEYLQSGQPRAYADHIYTARMHVLGKKLSETQAGDLARALVRPWVVGPDERGGFGGKGDNWWKPWLKQLKLEHDEYDKEDAVYKQTWYVHIEEAYCG